MKLAKLSLAAIVAAGAMTTIASAQPLEEAIKGVEFSGFFRYRLDDKKNDNAANTSAGDWDILTKFVTPVTSNIKATFAGTGAVDSDNKTQSTSALDYIIGKAFLTYAQDGMVVKAGKQALGTPVTENGYRGDKGDGVIAMYTASPVTMAAAFFGNTKFNNTTINGLVDGNDVMALAAIASFEGVNAQVWGFRIPNVVDSMIFTQLDASFAGANVMGQYINTELDATGPNTSGDYFGLKAGYKMDQFSVNAGYTSNDDDMGIHTLSPDASGIIFPGWRLGYQAINTAGVDTYFGDAGVSMGKYGAKIGYAKMDADVVNADGEEIWGQISYDHAKNLSTYLKYSDMELDAANDIKHLRFEAKYSF